MGNWFYTPRKDSPSSEGDMESLSYQGDDEDHYFDAHESLKEEPDGEDKYTYHDALGEDQGGTSDQPCPQLEPRELPGRQKPNRYSTV